MDLDKKTLTYWRMCREARGLGDGKLTVHEGIEITNDLMEHMNPYRPLWSATAALQNNLIMHGGIPRKSNRKKKLPKNVVQLKASGTA